MSTLKGLFGDLVRAHRVDAGLSQSELSDAAGISEVWLRKIEHGAASPSFDTIERLAKSLDVHPAQLFGGAPAVDEKARAAFARLVKIASGRTSSDIQRIVDVAALLNR